MWDTNSLWFEVAIVNIIFAVGNTFFGHFEERTPPIRRLLKYLFFILIIITISYYFGRKYSMILLGLFIIPFLYIHAYLLPKKGINGFTAEPRDKYYEFRGWDKNIFRKKEEK